MERISVIGLGPVGASIGLALKRWIAAPEASGGRRREIEVVGFDFDTGVQKAAVRLEAVDRTPWNLRQAVRDASLVVLTVSATEERRALEELAPLLAQGTVVTDTAAHKQQSLALASEVLSEHVSFVGGHPVLPIDHTREPSVDLFAGVTYSLFPHPRAEQSATELVVGFVHAIGATPYFPDPAEHDAQVAATTMLPALAAVALMHTASSGPGWRDLSGMATSDLAELTRLASTPPEELAGMVAFSPDEAVRWLDSLIGRLGELRDMARRDDPEAAERLLRFFSDAHNAREHWLRPAAPHEDAPRPSLDTHVNRLFLGGLRRKRD
ncbi:MAG: prephenate dehydrogenase [Chloroflexota bacterium]|nr:prephenate dehydrogenase [Chloroflexota bacterium]